MFFFFFFQAEDGIRDVAVTGVQTCALPISRSSLPTQRRCRWVGRLDRAGALDELWFRPASLRAYPRVGPTTCREGFCEPYWCNPVRQPDAAGNLRAGR